MIGIGSLDGGDGKKMESKSRQIGSAWETANGLEEIPVSHNSNVAILS